MDIDVGRQPAHEADPQQRLARRLLERLRTEAIEPAQAGKTAGMRRRGLQLFSYCCFATERIARMQTPEPLFGVIVSGVKEFWLGDNCQRFAAGMVFVLPSGLECDIVNTPDSRNGLYESLFVKVPRLPRELATLPPGLPTTAMGCDMRVRLTDELIDALVHAAISLQDSQHASTLAAYRLAEVLLLLRDDPAARPLFGVPLPDRVAWLVRSAPTRPWTAEAIGRALGLGNSTLRRRLADHGTSLREIVATTRMDIAHRVLTSGEGNVSEAVAAAGYASRSHFTRRFRSVYGEPPSKRRRK
jgi:AraC-like DNA-binding protein